MQSNANTVRVRKPSVPDEWRVESGKRNPRTRVDKRKGRG